MKKYTENIPLADSFPVLIVMQHRRIENNIWTSEKWEVEAVVAGGKDTDDEPVRSISRIGTDDEKYIWSNYQINLFKDEAESYYFNIISETPYVFVVCRDEEDGSQLTPFNVSVNYDEAASYMELDDQVFQVTMPPEIYRWVEAYVINNYVPVKKKKRKLENWKDETKRANHYMVKQSDKQEPATGFMQRWSRRKIDAKSEISEDSLEEKNPATTISTETVVDDYKIEEYKTDADMPPLERLTEESDFSGFLSPRVSEKLRKQALRKLFHLPFMNVVDGLDDYAEDYSSFAPLGDIIPQEMKRMLEREKAKEQEDHEKQEEQTLNNEYSDDVENIEIDERDNEVDKTQLTANEGRQSPEHKQLVQDNDLLNITPNHKNKVENNE